MALRPVVGTVLLQSSDATALDAAAARFTQALPDYVAAEIGRGGDGWTSLRLVALFTGGAEGSSQAFTSAVTDAAAASGLSADASDSGTGVRFTLGNVIIGHSELVSMGERAKLAEVTSSALRMLPPVVGPHSVVGGLGALSQRAGSAGASLPAASGGATTAGTTQIR